MTDLDDSNLTDEQLALLVIAQRLGLYAVMEVIKLEKPVRNSYEQRYPKDSTPSTNETEKANEPPEA